MKGGIKVAATKGIDCAVPLTAEKAKEMAAAGMRFVCRYLVPVSMAWKRLTRAEAEAITAAGMKIVSVFQRGANDAAGGAPNGTRDGKAAYQEAKAIGQPAGTAIYFAVDFDAQPKDYDAIEAYLRAAAKELPAITWEYTVLMPSWKRWPVAEHVPTSGRRMHGVRGASLLPQTSTSTKTARRWPAIRWISMSRSATKGGGIRV